VSLTADCAGRRVKLGDTTGYPERNLLGERKVLRPAEADWRTPEAGTALENALRAACNPAFKGPFAGEAAQATDTQASAAPAPVAQASDSKAPIPQAAAPPPKATPAPRPPRVPKPAATVSPAATATVPPAATTSPAPKAPPRASISVQIGAYASQAEAQAAFATLPQDRTRSVEQAAVGGRTWYRLIVWGFASVQDAQRYCDQRKAAGGACFVRTPDKG
jgi:septal ring-binding cell division protein DamX